MVLQRWSRWVTFLYKNDRIWKEVTIHRKLKAWRCSCEISLMILWASQAILLIAGDNEHLTQGEGIPSGHQGTPSRRAQVVRIVAIQNDTVVCEPVDVWRRHLITALCVSDIIVTLKQKIAFCSASTLVLIREGEVSSDGLIIWPID